MVKRTTTRALGARNRGSNPRRPTLPRWPSTVRHLPAMEVPFAGNPRFKSGSRRPAERSEVGFDRATLSACGETRRQVTALGSKPRATRLRRSRLRLEPRARRRFPPSAFDSPSHRCGHHRRTDPHCNRVSERFRCSTLCWLFWGCVVQREDACFQSRRWLFDSVRTHRRHTQAVNGTRSRPVCAQAFPGSNPGGGMLATVPARDFAGLGSLA